MQHRVTPANLSETMDFDHVIEVRPDLLVIDRNDIYAPDLFEGKLQDDSWTLVGPYSGQQGGGSVMHNSEQIGGRMAEEILRTPGIYVAVMCFWDDDESDDGMAVEGWAVARRDA